MNILVVTHSTKYSGANRSLYSVILQLRLKNNVTVLVNDLSGDLVVKLKQININCIEYKYGWWVSPKRRNIIRRFAKLGKDYAKYRATIVSNNLLRKLKEKHIDVVYTNTSTIDFGQRIANKLSVPHVWHVREFGKEDFGFINLTSQLYKVNTFNSADRIITISKALTEKFEHIVPSDKVKLVYNGFDVDSLICNTRKQINPDRVNIISVGQVCEAKGQDQLIRACNKLISMNYKIELYLAGNVDAVYLKKYVGDVKRYPWLHILGQVNDIYAVRNNMDIEVLCSRSEAFGRVTIEAMLHSIPFIGADCGCTKELIEDGYNGLLYEYGNIDALTKCIGKLIDNRDLYETIRENEIPFAKQFTIEKTVREVEKVIATVAENHE